jgi:thymidine phosphorylase
MTDTFTDKGASSAVPLNSLRARRLGLDTHYEAVVFLHKESRICRSEGFVAHTRVLLCHGTEQVIATLYHATGNLIAHDEAALSESAWSRLGLKDGERIVVTHTGPLDSLSHLRSRIYGHELSEASLHAIIQDVVEGKYSDIHLSSFLTACAARALDRNETLALTHAMVEAGDRLKWPAGTVVDKHCAGGLPGNRTTPIIVAIVTALGLTMPKTSSRAITSPAGTADTMETMAPVELDTAAIRRVVEREGGCIVWGGAVNLSPADDILIRVERALDLDTEGQLIASILSKKLAAGSSHLIIDLPVGPTAKVRSQQAAEALSRALTDIAETFGLRTRVVLTDGLQPIGRGIGPALEARDVLSVLQCRQDAPADLRERALMLTAAVLELAEAAAAGQGHAMAMQALDSGGAWVKFQAICEAQGGMRTPPEARQRRPLVAERAGSIRSINNRKIARLAKLAGAPDDKAAGVDLQVALGDSVHAGQPWCTVHADAPGVLDYAIEYAEANRDIVVIGQP